MIVRIVKHKDIDTPQVSDTLIDCDNVHWGKCKWSDESNQTVARIIYVGDFYEADADEGYIDTIKDSYNNKQSTVRYFIRSADVYVMNNEGKTIHKIVFD